MKALKIGIVSLIAMFFGFNLFAQTEEWLWAQQAGGTGNDIGNAIATDSNGNSYVTGEFRDTATFGSNRLVSNGDRDIFIAKLDTNGNYLWAKKAGGTSYDSGFGIATDSSGNSYVTGRFYGTAIFGSTSLVSSGSYDIFIAKLDTNGNWLWVHQGGGAGWDEGKSISIDNTGNSYMTGRFSGTATFGDTTLICSGSSDIIIAKLDTNGNWLWAKNAGGTSNDSGFGIATDSSGNSYVTGFFYGTTILGDTSLSSIGNYDLFITKINTNGDFLWANSASSLSHVIGLSISMDAYGNSYVTGKFMASTAFGSTSLSNSGDYDIFIAKIDPNGNWLWAKKAGGARDDFGHSIITDTDGNSFVTGEFRNAVTFGTTTINSGSNSTSDIFIAKLDTNGNWLWAQRAGGTGNDSGSGISIDSSENCYVTGYFADASTYGNASLISHGNNDLYIAKHGTPEYTIISPNGGEQWHAGNTQIVYWKPTGGSVRVFLSLNNGTNWMLMNSNPVSASLGRFSFTVPFVTSNQCLIRVENLSDTNLYDVSDAPFSISNLPPSAQIFLTSPILAKLLAGKSYAINWTANNVSNVDLAYSTNAGVSWQSIDTAIAANPGTYLWTVPDTSAAMCYLRVSDSSNPAVYDWSDEPFSICSLNLSSPNGGEQIHANNMIPILWDTRLIYNIDIEISIDNGLSWVSIASDFPSDIGRYDWRVSKLNSEECLIKISDSSDNSIFDVSEDVFAIFSQLELLYPTTNNIRVQTGKEVVIQWTQDELIGTINIQLSTNSISYTEIVSGIDPSLGEYLWTVPDVSSNACRIRISSEQNSEIMDYSLHNFSICKLTLISPNGEETWGGGSIRDISWDAINVTDVKIDYSADDGESWHLITDTTPAGDGTYSWTVPELHSEQCRIRLTDVTSEQVFDVSDDMFTIRPQIIVQNPIAGYSFIVGSIIYITWNAMPEVPLILIDYTIDGGTTWLPIQTSAYPASVGTYGWIIPNSPSENCKLRVRSSADSNVFGLSEGLFTISEDIQPPTVQFVADTTSGLEPLSVQFADESTAGTGNITSWLWDFGTGDSSTEQHPLYVYQDPGVYSVSLTVTNSADSTASLIREDYIEVIARVPDIELLSAESMSYGVVYLGDTSAAQSIEVKNVGTAPLNIETVSHLLGESPFALIDTPLPIVLAPDETAILNVTFAPLASGAVSDSIYIHSNADNMPVLAIGLRGTGEYVPPAAVTPPTVQILGNDAIITWEAVTETIYGSPITPDGYIVLYNETPYEDANYYYFLNFVPETSYTHTFVALFRPSMFYRVVAVKFYRESEREAVAGLRSGEDRITWKVLKERMQGLHRNSRQ